LCSPSTMEDLFYVLVAVVIIYVSYRWLFSAAPTTAGASARDGNTAATLGFRPRNVTPQMVQQVAAMFPDLPEDNIRYDLLRTGNVERTVNTVIEKGFLPAPPATYIRPASSVPAVARPAGGARSAQSAPKPTTLISRFHLEDRVQADDPSIDTQPSNSNKAAWAATPEQRQASLAERKAQMILAARKRLLEKQTKVDVTSSG